MRCWGCIIALESNGMEPGRQNISECDDRMNINNEWLLKWNWVMNTLNENILQYAQLWNNKYSEIKLNFKPRKENVTKAQIAIKKCREGTVVRRKLGSNATCFGWYKKAEMPSAVTTAISFFSLVNCSKRVCRPASGLAAVASKISGKKPKWQPSCAPVVTTHAQFHF